MTNFIINKHNHYFMLHNDVAKMVDVSKLQDCKTFDRMETFYEGVNQLFPEIDDTQVLQGSYIELWYDDENHIIVGDHAFINHIEFDADNFEELLSNYQATEDDID